MNVSDGKSKGSAADRQNFERRSAERARSLGLPRKGYYDDEVLFDAVIGEPELEHPRSGYASWLTAHHDEFSRSRGQCIAGGLELARVARRDPRVDFERQRPFAPSTVFYELTGLLNDGLVDFPRVHRGFVESVAIKATNLIELADELFAAAPIRFLDLIDVNRAVDELARWPGLQRMRALTFPICSDDDLLTDATIDRLLESPYLTNISAIRLVDQTRLTPAAYRRILTAPTLPRLSLFDIPAKILTCWAEPIPVWSNARPKDTLTYWENVIRSPPASGDLRDTPVPFIQRPEDWIVELERDLGYQPCLHPEEHYGRYRPALEVAIEHPIALDAAVMARRGERVPDLGPKPSLMARRAERRCAICGSDQLTLEYGARNPYADPDGLTTATLTCSRCGTVWWNWDP